ncbi:MAG: class I SAM-dependent methyltransferase [Candidatus Thorarchaeota archaeon]
MSENNEGHPGIDWSQYFVIPQQELHLSDFDNHGEWILDLGGGGEGIIGMMKGRDVIAIDRRKDELEETSKDSLKIVMDMNELNFLDGTFSTVTAFFTFMYIPEENFEGILKEVWRVMKPGGELLVWEPIFKIPPEEREKNAAVIPLKIHLPDGRVNQTGYGGPLRDLDESTILTPATKIGFKVLDKKVEEYTYFVRLQKP